MADPAHSGQSTRPIFSHSSTKSCYYFSLLSEYSFHSQNLRRRSPPGVAKLQCTGCFLPNPIDQAIANSKIDCTPKRWLYSHTPIKRRYFAVQDSLQQIANPWIAKRHSARRVSTRKLRFDREASQHQKNDGKSPSDSKIARHRYGPDRE